eukprot:COSAG02_NODE_16705_length_1062_cov_1.445483_2_plen_148_part_00
MSFGCCWPAGLLRLLSALPMGNNHALRSGGNTSPGDLYIRFSVDFPRKLARSVRGDTDDAKKSLEDLRQLLGQKSQNGSGDGAKSGVFSRGWWSRGNSSDDGSGSSTSDGGGEKPAVVAHRASAAQERALAAAERRQTSERERTEGF